MAKKRINLMMTPEIYKELQKKAIDEETSVSQLVENLGKDYLKKEKKEQSLSSTPEGVDFLGSKIR